MFQVDLRQWTTHFPCLFSYDTLYCNTLCFLHDLRLFHDTLYLLCVSIKLFHSHFTVIYYLVNLLTECAMKIERKIVAFLKFLEILKEVKIKIMKLKQLEFFLRSVLFSDN